MIIALAICVLTLGAMVIQSSHQNVEILVQGNHHDAPVYYNVELTKVDAKTGQVTKIYTGNVITAIGANRMRDFFCINATGMGTLGAAGVNTTTVLGVSNDPASSANNTCQNLAAEVTNNGFARVNGTCAGWWNATGNGNYALNVTTTFTASGTQQLQLCFLAWSLTPNSGSIYAVASFTQTTFNNLDTLTARYVITLGTN